MYDSKIMCENHKITFCRSKVYLFWKGHRGQTPKTQISLEFEHWMTMPCYGVTVVASLHKVQCTGQCWHDVNGPLMMNNMS